jgi:hypothetical protein
MISELLKNQIFVSVAITIIICEIWKFIDGSARHKRLNWASLVDTGGMPSSHATWVCSICISIGFVEGFTSSVFLLALGFAVIVVRDAFGVRRDVDNIVHTVNEIIREKKIGISAIMKITGHTPVQVFIGSALGLAVPAIIHFLFYAA